MANNSYYLEALLYFDEPATVKDIHARAVEMFGDNVKGDRTSCRLSLDRYVGRGKAEKVNGKYVASKLAADPIGALATKARVLEAQVAALRKENATLKEQVVQLKQKVIDLGG